MFKLFVMASSIFFCAQSAFSSNTLIRNAACHFNNKDYVLFNEKAGGLIADQNYVILEKDLQSPQKMARTLQGNFSSEGRDLVFPQFWRPTSIPLSSCKADLPKLHLLDEVIREFYVKTYFIMAHFQQDVDVEELVKRGEAFAFKVRVLCKSDDLTDDISLCYEVTLMDKIIPIDPIHPDSL